MPDFAKLYQQYKDQMEDFWGRGANAAGYERSIHVLGQPVIFHSNNQQVLEAAALAERMYSRAPLHLPPFSEKTGGTGGRPAVHVVLTIHDAHPPPGTPPGRLIDRLHYAGAQEWLMIQLGEWGTCFADLQRGEAQAVLASSLAEQPELVCMTLINTILTNMLTRRGFSMLHTSALVRDGRILLLMAPHGSGKSTTSLHLLLNGYALLSDSMIYVGERGGDLWLGGFPVGRIKLRSDMLQLFPQLASAAQDEPVRNEIKHRIDLERIDPALSCTDMVPVTQVEWCLLERWDRTESSLEPLTQEQLWPAIMLNSLHYDTPELWQSNLRRIESLLQHAALYRFRLGSSAEGILQSMEQLWK